MKFAGRCLLILLTLVAVGCSGGDTGQREAEPGTGDKAQPQVQREHSARPLTAEEALAKCRAAAAELGSTLKVALREAMREGGPTAALDVCHTRAPAIAAAIDEREGLRVGRTSLKWRSPDNAPDEWETGVMEKFEQDQAAGAGPRELETWQIMAGPDGARAFRYMKAIPTQPLCLKCHGTRLAPGVADKLAVLYPSDRATGFVLGDLRGAFSVVLPLPGGLADDSGP